jgi:biopolymer transport protein ExbD
MAPLIDIVFQLLIFFMLSSSFLRPALQLELPQAATEDEAPREHILVSADREGRVFVNQHESSLASVKADLAPLVAVRPDSPVHFQGDKSISYARFVSLLDAMRQAGAKQISIVHEGGAGEGAAA